MLMLSLNPLCLTMCTNCRTIFNPYSRKSVLVKCGKCDACLQEKACARSNRIRNNVTMSTLPLFITLTYTNDYVPFVYRSDLYDTDGDVNIYRSGSCRFVYDRHSDTYSFRKETGIAPIDTLFVPYENRYHSPIYDSIASLPYLRGLGRDKVGICYFPDLQKFFKRLRQILIRNYHYEKKFSYFSCSELGGHTQRPHFHALLFISPDDEAIFRSAISKAWPYADSRRTEKYIEIARDAASYVSSYVNSHLNLYPLFEVPAFKPKYSASKNFGVVLDCFSLDSILKKIDTGDLYYYCQKKYDGETDVVPISIPKYVINRYFPQFKGFSWLTPSQLHCILLSPARVGEIFGDHEIRVEYSHETLDGKRIRKQIPINYSSKIINPLYKFTPHETYQIYVRLFNAQQRFIAVSGKTAYDFADYYMRAWSLHSLTILKDSLLDIDSFNDWSDFYENANDVANGYVSAPTLDDLILECNPNNRSDVVRSTNVFKQLFSKLDKQKKVTNYCMSRMGHYV